MAQLKDLIVNGASRFIGKAYGAFVGSFSGDLDGNATTSTTANTAKACSGNSATASKLSTARKINITGNASGSATFDGTSDVSINVSVNESKHAVNADTATKVNATAPNGGTADLFFGTMAVNDFARIRVGGNNDNGWLEIATADGGNEPIYARQYGDGDGFAGPVTNEAVLLDGSGNTKFPHDVTAANFVGHLTGNADSATNATNATNANRLSSESGSNYLRIDTTDDSWSVIGQNPGGWLKSIRTEASAPPYSLGNYSAGIAFGGFDTKGIITHAYDRPSVKFAGGNGSTAAWKFTIYGGSNNETYDLNKFPTKTGDGASGTWPINISGTATKVVGTYTGNGGQQGPSFFGMRNAGFLMSNQPVNGHSEFKNWLYMDPYSVNDVGGATAIGVSRQETRAYIMSSNADRKQWDRTAELLSSANYNEYAPTKTGGGASGTWGINISGNAASATKATTALNIPTSDVGGNIWIS